VRSTYNFTLVEEAAQPNVTAAATIHGSESETKVTATDPDKTEEVQETGESKESGIHCENNYSSCRALSRRRPSSSAARAFGGTFSL